MLESLLRKYVKRGKFKLSHAGESNLYVDIKEAYGKPEVFRVICDGLWKLMENFQPTVVAGSGVGGIPLASAIAYEHGLKLTIVRKEAKEYGTQKQIEGYVPRASDRIALVDDVVTTGRSLEKAIAVLEQTNAEIACYVVVKRGEANVDVPLYYLIDISQLL